jgi:hypothetical protein
MAKSFTLLSATDAAQDLTSGALDLVDLQTGSFNVAFSGGAGNLVGTLYLQGSVDGTTFFNYPLASQAVTASTGHIWDLNPTGVRYFRVFWDYTSGTGNMAVTAYLKNNVVTGA